MNVVCVVVDQLHAGYLGCYGNSWITTPEIDQLASESLLFDQAYLESPDLQSFYRSVWTGKHHLAHDASDVFLPKRLSEHGIRTVLVTDEPHQSDSLPQHAAFDESFSFPLEKVTSLAESFEQTKLAEFFASASNILEQLQQESSPYCMWIHTSSLGQVWDAPMSVRESYLEDEEEIASESWEVPHRYYSPDSDPDEWLMLRQTYGSQVNILDTCVGVLWEQIKEANQESNNEEPTLLVLMSSRGFPLAEHGSVGDYDLNPNGDSSQDRERVSSLQVERAQLPLILWASNREPDSRRSSQLVQPMDLMPTLSDWFELPRNEEEGTARNLFELEALKVSNWRDRILLCGTNHEFAIRTPAWYLMQYRLRDVDGDVAIENALYVKPDDRWEMNDVADRCRDIEQDLKSLREECQQQLVTGATTKLTSLHEVLKTGMD